MHENLHEQASDLGASKERLVAGVRRLMADAEELLRGGSAVARRELADGMDAAQSGVGDVLGRVRARVGAWREALAGGELPGVGAGGAGLLHGLPLRGVRYVRAHPGRALGVAIVVGVVLGALAGARRSRR